MRDAVISKIWFDWIFSSESVPLFYGFGHVYWLDKSWTPPPPQVLALDGFRATMMKWQRWRWWKRFTSRFTLSGKVEFSTTIQNFWKLSPRRIKKYQILHACFLQYQNTIKISKLSKFRGNYQKVFIFPCSVSELKYQLSFQWSKIRMITSCSCSTLHNLWGIWKKHGSINLARMTILSQRQGWGSSWG